MPNTIDQDKEANPIAEIFDEMFTLLQDLETRSVAVLEYIKEQGGASDEKLAPFMERSAAASDVRWRAARARMEHLLAPKPRSSTDLAKDDKAKSTSQPKEKGKDSDPNGAKSLGEKQQGAKPESKDLGAELTSATTGTDKPSEQKHEKSQTAKPETDAKTKENEKGSGKLSQEPTAKASDAESQAAALAGDKTPDSQKDENADNRSTESDSDRASSEGKKQTQKAAK